jgi:hypothetical protein
MGFSPLFIQTRIHGFCLPTACFTAQGVPEAGRLFAKRKKYARPRKTNHNNYQKNPKKC